MKLAKSRSGLFALGVIMALAHGGIGNAQAANMQIALTPAAVYAGSSVQGSHGAGSSSAFDLGPYAAGNIFNHQFGPVNDSLTQAPSGAWIASGAQGMLYINLGQSTVINAIEFFNTHDGSKESAGTDSVSVYASHSTNFTHPTTLLNQLALSSVAGESTINGQTFNLTGSGSWQYLKIVANSAGCDPAGLDEVKIFSPVSPVPELPLPLMLAPGLLIPLGRIARRRARKSC
jgi:hypothetical protein